MLTCESLRPSHLSESHPVFKALLQPSVGEAVLEDIARRFKKIFFKVFG